MAEADFSFGDGVVESIEVPINGGGFNVGVKWDEPERGGPTWSAQGGGRGAEHLLVLEPPPQFAGAAQLPAKEYSTFQCRFGRSPTPSEAELGEEDWDEIAEVEAAAAAMPTGRPRRNSSALLGSDYDDSEEEEARACPPLSPLPHTPPALCAQCFHDCVRRVGHREDHKPHRQVGPWDSVTGPACRWPGCRGSRRAPQASLAAMPTCRGASPEVLRLWGARWPWGISGNAEGAQRSPGWLLASPMDAPDAV